MARLTAATAWNVEGAGDLKMATTHRQAVINKAGKLKIQQYGRWDGYPAGQGASILAYLKNGDLDKYQEELNKVPLISEEQAAKINKSDYPYLSENCGSDIHQMIEDGVVEFVDHIDENEARGYCLGFYTIDFQRDLFITEYYDHKVEFGLSDLPTEEEYLRVLADEYEG